MHIYMCALRHSACVGTAVVCDTFHVHTIASLVNKRMTCGSILEPAHILSSTLLSHLSLSFVSQHSPLSPSPPTLHRTHTDPR